MSDTPYRVDIDSIRRAFPPDTEAPPLLLDFARWLEGRPWGSVGCFDLIGSFADDAPIVDGSPLRKHLALFARLPDGSVVGAWNPAGGDMASAPIVVLGSEGQHEVLAASVAGWLARIAVLQFEADGEWTDFTPHEDVEGATDELLDWLAERMDATTLEKLLDASPAASDFAGWMGKWCDDREIFWSTHPMLTQIADALKSHRPAGKNPWDKTAFQVGISGEQFQIRVLRRGWQLVKESVVVEPMLRKLRDQMCREQPALGLWYSMSFWMYADGRILPSFDYEARPNFAEQPADIAGAKADLARAPRPVRWVPAWLTDT